MDELKKVDLDKFPRKAVPLRLHKTDSQEVQATKFAELATSPELAGYRVINAAELDTVVGKQLDVPALMEQLKTQANRIHGGDLSQLESMLMVQASALQSMFASLTEKAMTSDRLSQMDAYMRLALRAQAQSRSTVEALVGIKTPPIVYAKQANVTTGPQQINNAFGADSLPCSEEMQTAQNQLSGITYELRQNCRASSQTS